MYLDCRAISLGFTRYFSVKKEIDQKKVLIPTAKIDYGYSRKEFAGNPKIEYREVKL